MPSRAAPDCFTRASPGAEKCCFLTNFLSQFFFFPHLPPALTPPGVGGRLPSVQLSVYVDLWRARELMPALRAWGGGEVPNVGQSGELQGPGSRLMRGLPRLDCGQVLNTQRTGTISVMLLMQVSHSKVFSHWEPVAAPDPSSSAPLGVQRPASWTARAPTPTPPHSYRRMQTVGEDANQGREQHSGERLWEGSGLR